MDPNAFANKGMFDNWGDMFQAYFGRDALGMFSNKANAPYLTTTTNLRNIVYGAWATTTFVCSHNGLGAMRDGPWRSGYRLINETYFGSTPDGDGVDQGAVIPESTQDKLDILELTPKTLSNVLDISTAQLSIENKDDSSKWAELVDARRKTMMNNWDRAWLGYAGGAASSGNKALSKLDSILSSYDRIENAGEGATAGAFTYAGKTRAAASEFDCKVKHFSGVKTPFALKYMDDLMAECQPYWDDGGFNNKHWLTGVDTGIKIQQLHMTQFRGKLDAQPATFSVGGVKTMPGTNGYVLVNMYDYIPIIVDKFMDNHVTGAVTGGTKVALIDDDYMEIAVSQPIEYQESKEYLQVGYLAKRGIFHACMETAAWKFGCHGLVMQTY